jgi:small GTP-binding protein
MRLLTEAQQSLLNDERRILNDLRAGMSKYGASEEEQKTLGQSLHQLDELFLVVVVGEFNAGKSSLINALLGQDLLKEGVTPTTAQINILRYGAQPERQVENPFVHLLTAPAELLREVSIVDTPGTNAIIRQHEALTTEFVPRSDLVLFVTSVDRPFTESERAFMELIRSWGKKVVIALNKADLLQSEAELSEVMQFISDNSAVLFGETPEIFPVSARLAQRAKRGEPQLWGASRFEALENYIFQTLDQNSRLRLKYLNPLGVAETIVSRLLGGVRQRTELLKTDFSLLEDVENQLKLYQDDMRRDFTFRMADLENTLFEMEQRGDDYFNETMRIGRLMDLLDKARIQREFEQKVVGDVPQQIENKVNALIDWLVESDFRQWQAVMEHLSDRRRAHQERLMGDPGLASFHSEREHLIEGMGRRARQVIEGYDRKAEAQEIAIGAQSTVAALAAVEAGAVGLGALVTALATTAAADASGILLASLVAVLGLFVIPARRRQARHQLRQKLGDMREKLAGALKAQFEKEITRSLQNIQETITPYTRFIRTEQTRLNEGQSEINRIQTELESLRLRVEQTTS